VQVDARPNPGGSDQIINLAGQLPGSAPGGALSYSAAADFTGDGLDEILFVAQSASGNSRAIGLVATAADTTNPGQGVRVGPVIDLGVLVFNPHQIAIDTSTGTPRIFVAGTTGPSTSLCPGGTGLALQRLTVNPQTLALIPQGVVPVNLPVEEEDACMKTFSIDVGWFGATHGQLAVAYAVPGGTVKVIPIDVNAQGNLLPKTLFDTGSAVGVGRTWLRSGEFDWTRTFDQAALVIAGQENSLRILTFGQNLTVQSGPVSTAIGQFPLCVGDVAVGNFDHMQENPTPPPDTLRNPNLQLAAFLQTTCGTGNFAVQIWEVTLVDPTSGAFQVGPGSTVYSFNAASGNESVDPLSMVMAAVDLQGRSLRLGAPIKATIASRSQPAVVVGVPPMHVDFVTPVGKTAPQVLNVSVVKDGFYAQYNIIDQTDQKSSSQHTTSWSTGTKEEADLSFGIGDVAEGEGFDQTYQSAEQAWKANVQSTTEYGSASE
jgi:hypothetical protein